MKKIVSIILIFALALSSAGPAFAQALEPSPDKPWLSKHLDGVQSDMNQGFTIVLTSTDTFLACKTLDVVTTMVALNSGKFVEVNPILKLFIGPHNFVPLIAFSILVYLILVHENNRAVTGFANVITCGVGFHNLFLLHSAAGLMH